MAKINTWSGDDFTAMAVRSNEINEFAEFCKAHGEVYIYGAGQIGGGLKHYMEQSDIPCAGAITSDAFNGFKDVYREGRTGVIIGLDDKYLPEIAPLLYSFVKAQDVFTLSQECREVMGRQCSELFTKEHFWINVFVTHRCNLNCKSCSTFSPITPLCKTATDYDPKAFERDILRLKALELPVIHTFKFTGGETFIHPQLFDMLKAVYDAFPKSAIECYTNGTLLGRLSAEKLALLKKYNVTVTVTEYPVKGMDLSGFYKTADEMGINYQVISGGENKMFFKRPLNFDKSTPKHAYFECLRYIICNSLFLYGGKLWKCVYSFSAGLLNEAFGTDYKYTDGDYVDLYETSPEEIYRFAVSRIPFCGYCKPITEQFPWGLSERRLDEWT